MAGSSTDASLAQRDALLKCLENFNSRDYVSRSVSDVAKYLFKVYSSDGAHDTSLVYTDMESFFPASVVIFSRDTFRHTAHAVVLLHDTGRFFNAFSTTPTVLESLPTSNRAS